MIIKFNVQEQTLGASCHSAIISRSQDYLKAEFCFSTDWNNAIRIAQFVRDDLKYNIMLDSDNTCFVPWELLTSQGTFTVTVWANNYPNQDNLIITTNKVSINVFPDGLDEDLIPKDPTQGMEGEIVTTCLQAAEEAKNSATASANSASEALGYKNDASASATLAEHYSQSALESANAAAQSASILANTPHLNLMVMNCI